MSEWRWRAFKLMQSIVERLPRSWAYALAVLAARFAWMFSPLARPRLDYNLAIVCPELTPVELRKVSWTNFRNHAKAYADLMMLPRMNVEAMRPLMHVDGLENLAHARAMGKGVLVVSCHMGSYEVASYRDTRARLGISVLPLHLGGLRKVTEALKEQEIVITAIDRDITGTGRPMPFFGRPARIPMGPAAIALRMGTPLLPACVYRLPDDTYRAEAAPPVIAQPTGDPRADEERVTKELLLHIEGFIRRHPEHWHVPHRIWEGAP